MTQPRRPRVLAVYKKSELELSGETDRVKELIARNDLSVERFQQAHDDHHHSIAEARAAFDALGVDAEMLNLRTATTADGFDLVVTLGGDGTLLWASHLVSTSTPMLAVNTAPRDSVGYFCGAKKGELEERLAEALAGRLPRTELTRMRVEVDGRVVSSRVLNDVLYCHECPAAVTRYVLFHGDAHEEQRSSGVWVGPAAGSTAAQRSAGGRVLPLGSRRLQYVVREPYTERHKRLRLVRGLVDPGDSLTLLTKTSAGRLFVDGPYREHAIPLGSRIVLSRSAESLVLLGIADRRRSPRELG